MKMGRGVIIGINVIAAPLISVVILGIDLALRNKIVHIVHCAMV